VSEPAAQPVDFPFKLPDLSLQAGEILLYRVLKNGTGDAQELQQHRIVVPLGLFGLFDHVGDRFHRRVSERQGSHRIRLRSPDEPRLQPAHRLAVIFGAREAVPIAAELYVG